MIRDLSSTWRDGLVALIQKARGPVFFATASELPLLLFVDILGSVWMTPTFEHLLSIFFDRQLAEFLISFSAFLYPA